MTATPLPDTGDRRALAGARLATPRSAHANARPSARHWERIAAILGLSFIVACSGSGGSGCSGSGGGLGKLKGGYPVDKRLDSAISLRLSKGLFDFLEANGAALVGGLLPADGIAIPSSCGGSTEVCCGQTCKVKASFTSLKFDPQPPSKTAITIRAKMQTDPDFNVKIPVIGTCHVSLDTGRSGAPDVGLVLPMINTINAETKLTSIDFDTGNLDIQNLDNGDIKISGGFGCALTDLLKGLFLGTIKDQIKKSLGTPLTGLMCQKCTTSDDCSSLADQGCSMDKKCMRKGVCMQQLGIEGRMDLSSLLGSLGGGSSSAIDIYAVAGSYADVEAAPTGGLSLGMLGGSTTPAPSACVPPRPAPTRAMPLTKTAAFAGNSAPNGKPYHVGLGLSNLELDSVGHSFYTTGGLCLAIGTAQVELLSSGLLSALIPSLSDLTRGQNAALQLVVRPQYAPVFTLGKGTYKTDGMGRKTLDDPLLSLQIKDLALDFYVYMDERMVRFMRQTVDVNVPIGLDIDNMGQIVPILGDLGGALGNVRVTDSALLRESPTQLAGLFPSLLPLVLGQVSAGIKPIALPDLLGLKLQPVQFTSTPDSGGKLAYLGLFLSLAKGGTPPGGFLPDPLSTVAPPAPSSVETYADLLSLEVPTREQLSLTQAPTAQNAVRATLQLAARSSDSGSFEWQYRVDGGLWRPFDDRRQLVVDDPSLRLPGNHSIFVRARIASAPASLDPTPARVDFVVAPATTTTATPPSAASAETAIGHQASGCTITTPASRGDGLFGLGVLAVALLSLLGLRRRRPASWTLLGATLVALSTVAGSGCSGDNTQGQGTPMDPGPHPEFNPNDEVGRYQSALLRDGKIYISAYNSTNGDLAFTSVAFDDAPSAKLAWLPVDGLPSGDPTNKDKSAYRGGYEDAGDDVGRFTALAMSSQGTPLIAYQDATNGAVKLAIAKDVSKNLWDISTLTTPAEGKLPGSYISMVLDDGDLPIIAYMVQGVKKDGGKRASRLVVARAGTATPTGSDGWQKSVIAEVATSCAGLCDSGEACVYSDPMKKDKLATVCQAMATSCTPGCKGGQACMAGACVDALASPAATEPEGTGIDARLVRGSTTYLVFRDQVAGALKVATGSDWKVTTLAGGDGKSNVGQGLGATLGSDGTLHVAYGDASHQLHYGTLKGGMWSPSELVDDGTRTVGMTPEGHWVGGGLWLVLDGDQPVVAYQDQTAGSLELAKRVSMKWSHQTLADGGMRFRGSYPQAVSKDGKWLILDIIYDRAADALSTVGFSPL